MVILRSSAVVRPFMVLSPAWKVLRFGDIPCGTIISGKRVGALPEAGLQPLVNNVLNHPQSYNNSHEIPVSLGVLHKWDWCPLLLMTVTFSHELF